MPTFAPPSISTSEGTVTPRSKDTNSERSFHTAEEEEIQRINKGTDSEMAQGEGHEMTIDEPSRPTTIYETNALIKKLEERDAEQRQEIEAMRADMKQMMTAIVNLSLKQQGEMPSSIPPEVTEPISTQQPQLVTHPVIAAKVKELKWPAAYDHSNPNEWRTTHGLLLYIYNRDVVEKGILQPSDFFMQLFSHAVTGIAKEMILGQFEEMMNEGNTTDALGLLSKMDNIYRDRNAEQTAANLLHACRQFRDESLSSFLPRFQQLLTRSPSSARDDKGKTIYLKNALNQATKTFMIGRTEPEGFQNLMKYLSIMGSQMDQVSHIKTRNYHSGQTGTFDDGTKGIAGGKLLGSATSSLLSRPTTSAPENILDADGDTKMTGVNKIHAKWVSKIELDQRRAKGECIRCGKKGHRIQRCKLLPAIRPQINVKSSTTDELEIDHNDEEESLKE